MSSSYLIAYNDKNALFKIRDAISSIIKRNISDDRHIVLICIGSDRSTGDSLGPIVGEKLKFLQRANFSLYGTLENPVHAKNLCETLTSIKNTHKHPYIIAVDASLGTIDDIGNIIIKNTPLMPGSALDKKLPPVGDLSIKGIVNVSGALDFMVLQNTRLYTVMLLADIISNGIYHAIIQTMGSKKLHSKELNISCESVISN